MPQWLFALIWLCLGFSGGVTLWHYVRPVPEPDPWQQRVFYAVKDKDGNLNWTVQRLSFDAIALPPNNAVLSVIMKFRGNKDDMPKVSMSPAGIP